MVVGQYGLHVSASKVFYKYIIILCLLVCTIHVYIVYPYAYGLSVSIRGVRNGCDLKAMAMARVDGAGWVHKD